MSAIQEFYQREYRNYETNPDVSYPQRRKYTLVLENLTGNERVLDVGSANGLHMCRIAPHCREVEGIDLAENMVKTSRATITEKGITNANVQVGDAQELPFEDQSFDLAYSFSTLVLVPDMAKAVSEIVRVLKPGGLAILDIPGRRNLSYGYHYKYYQNCGHFGVNGLTWPQTQELLADNNLAQVSSEASGFCDQYLYIPVIKYVRRLKVFQKVFHFGQGRDLDSYISNSALTWRYSNRWYIVARKDS